MYAYTLFHLHLQDYYCIHTLHSNHQPSFNFVDPGSLKWLESSVGAVTLNSKVTILILMDHSSIEELLNKGSSCFIVGPLLLQ